MSDQKDLTIAGETEDKRTQNAFDVRDIVRQAIQEFVRAEEHKDEPAYKAELHEERKRREHLETRLNQLVEENRRARAMAEEADRNSQIRSELQRLGVTKVDLAFRAVKDDIIRSEDGRLQGRGPENKPIGEYLASFVKENPELLPARISGGSGAQATSRQPHADAPAIDLAQIRPGMNQEALDRVRQEISRLAVQTLRGA
jgi:hypothetical protein